MKSHVTFAMNKLGVTIALMLRSQRSNMASCSRSVLRPAWDFPPRRRAAPSRRRSVEAQLIYAGGAAAWFTAAEL